jgi:hypothetical protein
LSHKLESLQASYPQYLGSTLIMLLCQVWGAYPFTSAPSIPIFVLMMARILRGAEGGKNPLSP